MPQQEAKELIAFVITEGQEPTLGDALAQFGFAVVLDGLTHQPTLLHVRPTGPQTLEYFIKGSDNNDYVLPSDIAEEFFNNMQTCEDRELIHMAQSLYTSLTTIANAPF